MDSGGNQWRLMGVHFLGGHCSMELVCTIQRNALTVILASIELVRSLGINRSQVHEVE